MKQARVFWRSAVMGLHEDLMNAFICSLTSIIDHIHKFKFSQCALCTSLAQNVQFDYILLDCCSCVFNSCIIRIHFKKIEDADALFLVKTEICFTNEMWEYDCLLNGEKCRPFYLFFFQLYTSS